MIFSEKLSLIRRSKGHTQEQLAEQLGVSRQAVAKWESGVSHS
ncbi:helix-turn-helix transcriptional regulator [Lacrimispora sp.]